MSVGVRLLLVALYVTLALFAAIPLRATHAQTSVPTPAPPTVPTAPISGAAAVSADQVNAVSRNLYCPVCQNTPLEVCPTDACARWRDQVRELLSQGQNEEQVRQYFIDHFGMRTVGTPTDSGSRLLTIGLPLALIAIIGALMVVQVIRRYNRRPVLAEAAFAPTVSDPRASPPVEADFVEAYRARLEAEVEERS